MKMSLNDQDNNGETMEHEFKKKWRQLQNAPSHLLRSHTLCPALSFSRPPLPTVIIIHHTDIHRTVTLYDCAVCTVCHSTNVTACSIPSASILLSKGQTCKVGSWVAWQLYVCCHMMGKLHSFVDWNVYVKSYSQNEKWLVHDKAAEWDWVVLVVKAFQRMCLCLSNDKGDWKQLWIQDQSCIILERRSQCVFETTTCWTWKWLQSKVRLNLVIYCAKQAQTITWVRNVIAWLKYWLTCVFPCVPPACNALETGLCCNIMVIQHSIASGTMGQRQWQWSMSVLCTVSRFWHQPMRVTNKRWEWSSSYRCLSDLAR